MPPLYQRGSGLSTKMVHTIKTGTPVSFRARYRSCLLMDRLQYLVLVVTTPTRCHRAEPGSAAPSPPTRRPFMPLEQIQRGEVPLSPLRPPRPPQGILQLLQVLFVVSSPHLLARHPQPNAQPHRHHAEQDLHHQSHHARAYPVSCPSVDSCRLRASVR